jgi:DNA-binding SARP family transcriptional activator
MGRGNEMPALQLLLLGPFELRYGDMLLPRPATHNASSLLAYLAVHPGPQPREFLAELFWPGCPPVRGLRSLSTALWHIRRVLPAGECIAADAQRVCFVPGESCWLDVAAFEQELQAAAGAPGPNALSHLESAVALYRGDFLAEFYDDWCLEERYRLEVLYLEALRQLAAGYEVQGECQEALRYAHLLLERDPLQEDVQRAVIRLYAGAGNRAEAVRQAQRCRAVLQREIGLDLSPETVALCDELLDPSWREVTKPPLEPPGSPERRAAASFLECPPFVGREHEWQLLLGCWEQARSGQGRIVLVSGEAGIGKSRLVEELERYIRQHGGWAAAGCCYEQEYALPHGLLTDLLRAILATTGQQALQRLPSWQVAELSRLAPDLGEHLPPSLRQATPENHELTPLFEALTLFLLDLAQTNPLLLVLEDLHWAPDPTLAWLSYLARRVAATPLLLIATYRCEEVSTGHPLQRLAATLAGAERLEIAGLSHEDLRRWLVGASEPLVAWVHQQAAGNPFFTLETLRALVESGHIRLAGGHWIEEVAPTSLPISGSVRHVVQTRLGRLSATARQVLALAAVIGPAFGFDVLVEAADLGEEAVLEALDELLGRRLVREAGASTDADYEFEHHLVREVVYQGLQYRRRRLLHGRVAAALDHLYGDRPETHAILAHHCHLGGRPAEAVRSSVRAGEQALQAYAVQQAAGHLANALEWAREARLSLDEEFPSLHATLGDALRRSGRYDEALAHYAKALPLVPAELKQLVAYNICALGAMRQGNLGEFNRLIPVLEAESAGTDDSWALVMLRWIQAFTIAVQGDAARARSGAAVGLRMARRLSARGQECPPWLEVLFSSGMARACEWWGEWPRAVHHAGKALALCSAAGDLNGVAASHDTLGAAHYGLGEWEQALEHLQRCYDLAASAGDPRLQGQSLYDAALVYLERGDWAAAEENAHRVMAAAEAAGDALRRALGHLLLARLSLCRGAPRRAIPALQLLARAARRAGAAIYVVVILRFLAEAHLLAGKLGQAISTAQQGLELAGRTRQKREQGALWRIMGEARARSGQPQEAAQCLQEAAALAGRIRCRYDLAVAWRCLGQLRAQAGAHTAAREHLAAALELFTRLGAEPDAAVARRLLADLDAPPAGPGQDG